MVGVRGAPASKKSHRSSPVRNEVVRGAGQGEGGWVHHGTAMGMWA